MIVVDFKVTANSPISLYVDGTSLKNGNGVVRLRGTQIDSNVAYGDHDYDHDGLNQDGWFNQSDVQRIAAHGGNMMELHLQLWNVLEPTQGTPDLAWFQSHMDNWVSWCQSAGVYTIINMGSSGIPDWALAIDGNPNASQFELDFWNTDNHNLDIVRTDYANLFAWMANRYKNNPYVNFDFSNEPLGNPLITYSNAAAYSAYYAGFITTLTDAVASTGSAALIFVDKPYCWFRTDSSNYVQVNRSNIVWEDHLYVDGGQESLAQWKSDIDTYIQRYTVTFEKPFFLGEYGFINSITGIISDDFPDWQNTLSAMVNYIDSKPLAGAQWHEYPFLHNEWYDYYYSTYENHPCFTQTESEWILNTVLNGPNPPPSSTPTHSPSPTHSSSPTPSSNSSSLKVLAEVSTTVATGQTWAFSVQVSGGSMPYSYQWYEGTTPLSNQNSDSLTTTKSTAGTYTYYCQVTDAKGTTTTSNTVTLTVISTQQTTLPTNATTPPPSTTSPTASPQTPSTVSPSTTVTFIIAALVVITTIITGPLASVLRKRRNSHFASPKTPE